MSGNLSGKVRKFVSAWSVATMSIIPFSFQLENFYNSIFKHLTSRKLSKIYYQIKTNRNEKLEAEAKTSVEKFKEITGKWVSAHVREVPYSLHKLVVDQQKMCDMVIEEKNKIIKQIQIVRHFCCVLFSFENWK